MSVFKCKMCGGTIEFEQGASVGVCDSCGTKQTLPKLDDDKRANMYDRANHFRRNNDYDKAMGIYEQILNEDNTDAEAYWSIVLCRYGIEYVEDPKTHSRIPTVNRAQFTSIYMDEDYKSALQYADGYQRQIYEKEAKAIDDIQKGILEISSKEEPFDVFVCYKETDANGRRTPDSVLANDLYHQLTQEGYKVFFSRITLEDKLGVAYEPYIFAALNSAKVMVVLGTKAEYFNAVWVRNEWSRFLSLIKQGQRKMLIPAYKDMDPYDLPEEFSHLQAQDMSKLGFMQDLLRGIKKILSADLTVQGTNQTIVVNNVASQSSNTSQFLKRAFMLLEDENWQSADEYAEKVLDVDPECADAYLAKLMVETKCKKREELGDLFLTFENSANYKKLLRFGDDALKNEIRSYLQKVENNIDNLSNNVIALYNQNFNTDKALKDDFNKLTNDLKSITALETSFSTISNSVTTLNREEQEINKKITDLQRERDNLGLFAFKQKRTIDDDVARLKNELENKSKQCKKQTAQLMGCRSVSEVSQKKISIQNDLAKVEELIKNNMPEQILPMSFDDACFTLCKDKALRTIVREKTLKRASVGGIVILGTYQQDYGPIGEPIVWRVLAKEGNKILVISEKILDIKEYAERDYLNRTRVSWDMSSLRKWLRDSFFDNAFDAREQSLIADTRLKAEKYGHDTTDKIFVLSKSEAEKYLYNSNEYYKVQLTGYSSSKEDKTVCFWLRTPSDESYDAVCDCNGYWRPGLSYNDHDRTSWSFSHYTKGVRPCMWLSLDRVN